MRELYLLLFSLLLPALATRITCRYDSSIQTLEALVKCYERYTVPEGHYTSENAKHCSARPTTNQLWAWKVLVTEFWKTDLTSTAGNLGAACKEMQYRSPSLPNIYESWIFKDGYKNFCVLSEMYTDPMDSNVYSRGWGLLIVPLIYKEDVPHVLHLSVPRPLPGMAEYAATVFKTGLARSLLINGRHPRAIRHSSSCVQPTSNCEVFHKTDAVYDKVSLLSSLVVTIVIVTQYRTNHSLKRHKPSLGGRIRLPTLGGRDARAHLVLMSHCCQCLILTAGTSIC